MIRLLLPVLLALLGLGGGVGAGIMLRPAPEPMAEEIDESEMAKDPDAEEDHTDAEEHAEAEAEAEEEEDIITGDSEYTKMGEPFVVPVLSDGSVAALVVMSLSVENAPGFGDEIMAHAPKLRDVFLREMLDHANLGGFRGSFTSNGTMDRLRRALRETGKKAMGENLRDVLILDINRQELG